MPILTIVGWIHENQQGTTRKGKFGSKRTRKTKLWNALCWFLMLPKNLWMCWIESCDFQIKMKWHFLCTRLTFILTAKYAQFLILLVFSLKQYEVIRFRCIATAVVFWLVCSFAQLSTCICLFRWFFNRLQRFDDYLYSVNTKIIHCTNNKRISTTRCVSFSSLRRLSCTSNSVAIAASMRINYGNFHIFLWCAQCVFGIINWKQLRFIFLQFTQWKNSSGNWIRKKHISLQLKQLCRMNDNFCLWLTKRKPLMNTIPFYSRINYFDYNFLS